MLCHVMWPDEDRYASSHGHPIVGSACMYLDYDSDFDDFFNIKPSSVGWEVKSSSSSSSSGDRGSPPESILGGEGAMW